MDLTPDEAADAFEDSAKALEEPMLAIALQNVQIALGQQLQDEFTQEHDPTGDPWIQSVRARKEGGKTLVETGLLYMAAASAIAGANVGDDELSYPMFATLPEYADVHEYGAEQNPVFKRTFKAIGGVGHVEQQYVGEHDIPARPFLGFGPDTIEKAIDFGADELTKQLLEVWS
jgi:phage gpG-like protein